MEADEGTPLLEQAPESTPAEEPVAEEVPPAESPAPAIQVQEAEDEATPEAACQVPILQVDSADEDELKNAKAQSTMHFMHIMQFFLSCCFPIMKPQTGSQDSSRRPSTCPYPEKNVAGKLGVFKKPDDQIIKAFAVVEDAVKEKMSNPTVKGASPETLVVVGYKEQHVFGTNLFAKVKIDDGPEFIHVKIFQPIQGEPCLLLISQLKTDSDVIEYF